MTDMQPIQLSIRNAPNPVISFTDDDTQLFASIYDYDSQVGLEVVLLPIQAKQIAEFCMAYWIRHASTMKFDSLESEL
jgi:hypothetical protein